MTEKQIKLAPEQVTSFVKMSQKCDFNIDVAYNRLEIDAKSLLGVLSLDLNRTLRIRMDGHNAEFENFLDALAV